MGMYIVSYVNGACWWGPQKYFSTNKTNPPGHAGGKKKSMPLWKKYFRRINRLMRLFATLDPQQPPRWFISLVFDRAVRREWSMKRCQKCFAKFKKHLAKAYPDCWFIYVWDYSPKAGFHVHLFGGFGKKGAWRKVHRKWLALTGSKDESMADKARFVPKMFGYQVSRKKFDHKLHVSDKLSGKALWGVINKKNVSLSAVKTAMLDEDGFYAFLLSAEHQLLRTKGREASELDYVTRHSGCMYFAGPKLAKTALKYVRKVKEATQ